jgi:hypothetical protein
MTPKLPLIEALFPYYPHLFVIRFLTLAPIFTELTPLNFSNFINMVMCILFGAKKVDI